MQRSLSGYLALAKRWLWLVMLGIVLCGSGTYLYTRFETPVYQASATIIINVMPSSYNNTQASIQAAPTYVQLVKNPAVLQPVLQMHPEMTLQQLDAMTTVSVQTNTQLLEVDVQNRNRQLAAQIANEISQVFLQYADAEQLGKLQALPAQVPTVPIRPKRLQDTATGALVGLGLAIALIAIFEWVDDRLASPEETQQVLDMEVLAVIPYVSRRRSRKKSIAIEEPGLIETYRTLCANLNAEQAQRPFKLVMVTSVQPADGKSNISANVASFLALTGKRVLLVDADLHRPVQAEQFQLDKSSGFSTAFTDGVSAQTKVVLNGQETSIPTLRVLTAGVLPPNPAELLQSALSKQLFSYFRDEAPFDYIIFDTPPLLALADAQVLTTRVDATILVANVDKTSRRLLIRGKRILKKNSTRILGVVVNKCRWPEYRRRSDAYYYYARDAEQPEVEPSHEYARAVEQPEVEPSYEYARSVEQPEAEPSYEYARSVEQPEAEPSYEYAIAVEQPEVEPSYEYARDAEQPEVEPSHEYAGDVEQHEEKTSVVVYAGASLPWDSVVSSGASSPTFGRPAKS